MAVSGLKHRCFYPERIAGPGFAHIFDVKVPDANGAKSAGFKCIVESQPYNHHLPGLADFGHIVTHVEMTEVITFPRRALTGPCLDKSVHDLRGAAFARPVMFDYAVADFETNRTAIRMIMGVAFFNTIASLAYEKFCSVALMGVIACDISIQGLNAVDQAEPGEKVQRAVNRRRFGGATFGAKFLQKVVGLDRAVSIDKEFENMGAQRRKPLTMGLASRSGFFDPVVFAERRVCMCAHRNILSCTLS